MQTDRIPVIGQNYGQSLLASLHSLAGLNFPLFSLNLWLGLHVFLLCALTFFLLRVAKLSRLAALIGSVGVMLGNTALSTQHVMVIDSLSPMLVNGYSDSLLSIGSLLAALVLTNCGLSQPTMTLANRLRLHLVLAGILISWSMTGAQNYYLYAAGFLILYAWHFRALTRRYQSLLGYVMFGLISL